MTPQYSQPGRPGSGRAALGCGLSGCAGGLLLGLGGGSVLLILVSLLLALLAAPPQAQKPVLNPPPDVRLVLHENLLNQVLQSSLDETAQVDILPGNRFQVEFDLPLSAFGVTIIARLTGLFELQLNGQTLVVNLLDSQVSGLNLPGEVTGYFNDNLDTLNQELNETWQETAAAWGLPLQLTGLGTNETELWFEADQGSP